MAFKIYHSGCLSCHSQEIHGIERCNGCEYKEANWDLPDLRVEKKPNKQQKEQSQKNNLEDLEKELEGIANKYSFLKSKEIKNIVKKVFKLYSFSTGQDSLTGKEVFEVPVQLPKMKVYI